MRIVKVCSVSTFIGGVDGHSGAWAYVMGGMGAVNDLPHLEVSEALINENAARGVRLVNGREVHAKVVLLNATPKVTFQHLVPETELPKEFRRAVKSIDYTSPVTKINVAVHELPSFTCSPNVGTAPMPHHQTTIHLNCESMQIVDEGVRDYRNGRWSSRPVIEMTIPSVVDRSLVPDDRSHVMSLFTQYIPYTLKDGEWSDERKEQYARHVFSEIDAYSPNFSSSVNGYEVLPPPNIERIFGLTGGNVFHGSMSLDQLYFTRPVAQHSNYSTPIKGLYLCGSGAHPGGGVTGAPGRLAALVALQQ